MEKEGYEFLFTSEQVSYGHPDKFCDYISDSLLDAYLAQDPKAKCGIETLAKNNTVVVAGEVTSTATIDVEKIVREAIIKVGYNKEGGYDVENYKLINLLDKQAPEIAQSVHINKRPEEIGAGDQGLMIGYATDETEEYLPMTLVYATKLAIALREAKENNSIPWLQSDAKTQVTMKYKHNKNGVIEPLYCDTVLISTQHYPGVAQKQIQEEIKEKIVERIIKPEHLKPETKIVINPSESFVIGGPVSDAGLTGRKIIADTYGGWGGHGGGAFSGKDATKVDRSGAYQVRQIAKSLVANGYCKRCIVLVSYGIGIAQPIELTVDTYGTVKEGLNDQMLTEIVLKNFDLRPGMIIQNLDLQRPIFSKICVYNHFMPSEHASWEKVVKF